MKLLFTITAYPPAIGGGQIHAQQLAKALSPRHAIEVFTFWKRNRTDWLLGTTLRTPAAAEDEVIDGLTVHYPGFSRSEKLKMLPFVLGYYPMMDVCLPALAELLRPHIEAYAQAAELIHHVRIGREPLGFASLAVARKNEIPFVMTPLHHPRWGGWLHRHYQALYRQADALIALTEMEKKILAGMGIAESKIFVTGHGAVVAPGSDGGRFRTQFGLGDYPMVLFLGQKYEYKGTQFLLEASKVVWASFPETRFVFIGPRTDYSKKLFSEQEDKRIIEMDAVDLQTKTDALAGCQLLCLPSSQESFGGVYTEAWCLGKPVIGCRIPAVAELIEDGQTGFLVEQSGDEIAERIKTLLKDTALAEAMGQAGKKLVEERFTWGQIARLTEMVYQQVTKG